MDQLKWERFSPGIKKYALAAAVLVLGLLLMALPEKKTPEAAPVPTIREETLDESLASMLSRLEGAGKVEVLLTQSRGPETWYHTDTDRSEGENGWEERVETVIITGQDRAQQALVRQEIGPVYQGAVVLCQGGADDRVRLQIVQAVMSVTGLRSDRITVLKMK